jgi:hypothetical protein
VTETFRLEDLLDIYDIGFLGYALNETRDQLTSRLAEGGSPLTTEKEAMLSELVGLENSYLRRFSDGERSFQRDHLLSQYRPDLGSTIVGHYRKMCGGENNDMPTVNDDVERLLLYFGEVTYPFRLQNDRNQGHISPVVAIFQDPMKDQLHTAVMDDGVLSKLYPNDSQQMGRSGSALRSTGRSGNIQLSMFAENITAAAWHYAHFDSERPSFTEYAHAILNVVQTLKKALEGKPAKVPMGIGLAGVLLPQGVESVDFGWSRLRRADQRDEYFTRRIPLNGQLQHTNAKGENIVIDYVGNLTLEFDVPFKIALKEHDLSDPWPDEFRISNEPVECLRLALILAGVGENSTAFPTWQSVVDPFSSLENIGFSDPKQGQNLSPAQLAEDQVESWNKWATMIHDHRTAQTNMSIRRILRAVSERKEPEDTLIDAVIVWENLFGSSQETTLRVTMSVAWMLGTDSTNRSALCSELKKVYRQRSDIVDGNDKLKTGLTSPYARRAIEVSLQLLYYV